MAQWQMLDSRPRGRRFEPHRRHCVVSLSKNIPSLVLVQSRKTHPFITERLLMGRKESNQTNKTPKIIIIQYLSKHIFWVLICTDTDLSLVFLTFYHTSHVLRSTHLFFSQNIFNVLLVTYCIQNGQTSFLANLNVIGMWQ